MTLPPEKCCGPPGYFVMQTVAMLERYERYERYVAPAVPLPQEQPELLLARSPAEQQLDERRPHCASADRSLMPMAAG